MKKETKAIVYAIDGDRFYQQLAFISLFSLMKKCENDITVYLMFEPGYKMEESAVDILYNIAKVNRKVAISCFSIPMKYNKLVKATGECTHLGKMCCARFFIPMVLPDVHQCLYLDTDTLFLKDPIPILNSFCNDGNAMASTAGVLDPVRYFKKTEFYTGMTWYVNGGSLLMDLDLWRTREIGQRLLFDTLTENRTFNDQDSLNLLERPIPMPESLNFISNWCKYFKDVSAYNYFYGTKYGSMDEVVDDMCILHYVGESKPFKDVGGDKPVPAKMKRMFEQYSSVYGEYLVTTKQAG